MCVTRVRSGICEMDTGICSDVCANAHQFIVDCSREYTLYTDV